MPFSEAESFFQSVLNGFDANTPAVGISPARYIQLMWAWNAVFTPKGTPAPALQRLNDALRAAVADAGLRRQMQEVGVDLPAGSVTETRRGAPTAAIFTLLLGLRERTTGGPTRILVLSPEHDEALDALFGKCASTPTEPTLHVQVSHDPSHAPANGEAWTVQVTVPRHGVGPGALDWTSDGVAGSFAQHLLDRLAGAGFDVRARIVVAERRSPADVERTTGSPGGVAYATAPPGGTPAYLRTANRSPVPGLFVVGASAHPGGGVPAALMSAALVADMVGRA